MKFLLKFRFPNDAGNEALRDPEFGNKMRDLLREIEAETVFFTTDNGQRCGYALLNMEDASQIPAIAEPFFLWLHADIKMLPVMLPEDLAKAAPAISAAAAKWG